uniref:UDP-N-acetylglucosamine--dolichyl-phosphate N-acetylglucosaminephosphotransferase n=1 Tax=Blastobotrys adeninivorans TaxID=409370 RepID=A0A060TDU9_BLAAD
MLEAAALIAGLGIIFYPGTPLMTCLGFSLVAFAVTSFMIPRVGPLFIKTGLKGRDLAKKQPQPEIPETMGAVTGTVYMFCMLFFIPYIFYQYLVTTTSGSGNRDAGIEVNYGRQLHHFPHNKLAEYLSALLCLQSMLMLGVADDLFDIRWRNKFFLPAIAAIPLLIVYYVDFGVTAVMLPPFLNMGTTIDLGPLYYVYMASVAIFCPNSINIYAGVNGLEVGQTIVIGAVVLLNDMLYLLTPEHPATESHLLSAFLVIPFMGVALALLRYNWYPSKVFVGDTFCYFSGMVFAVGGILGHFSKTLLLFFIPQVFNFCYSVPQLFKFIDCPRHRMPVYNSDTGLLEPSTVELKTTKEPIIKVLKLLNWLGLIGMYPPQKEGEYLRVSNMTLINLALVRLGPKREDRLVMTLLGLQLLCGLGAIAIRHSVAILVFGRDNL